jgi:hypothetical protein
MNHKIEQNFHKKKQRAIVNKEQILKKDSVIS